AAPPYHSPPVFRLLLTGGDPAAGPVFAEPTPCARTRSPGPSSAREARDALAAADTGRRHRAAAGSCRRRLSLAAHLAAADQRAPRPRRSLGRDPHHPR